MKYQTKVNRRNTERLLNPVLGVFRPSDDREEVDSDEDEEDKDIQFLNYKEMNSVAGGKTIPERKKPKKVKGFLVSQTRMPGGQVRSKQLFVQGSFHLQDPWWTIKILRTTKGRGLMFQRDMHALSYQIRTDQFVVDNGIIAQFLDKFEISQSSARDEFFDFVSQSNQNHKLTFEHLEELIADFAHFLSPEGQAKADCLDAALHHKEAGYIFKAMKFPKIFQLLPQLLPMQFMDIICFDEKDLHALNKDLDERPWIFGFKRFLNKDHHILGCEATWNAFEKSRLSENIQQPYRDALILYDFMKEDSYDGNTCVKIDYVKRELTNLVTNFTEAFKFLKRNKIVMDKTFNGVTWLFLYNLFKAEEYIAKGFATLFELQMKETKILEVDLESATFDNIRSDPDQLKAAEALKKYPVVVISGKGGCGKTTVVTQVMSRCVSMPQEQQNNDQNESDFIDLTANGTNMEDLSDPDRSYLVNGLENHSQNCEVSGTENECNGHFAPQNPQKFSEEIIYVAPTGKAANLLGRRANTTGYTLHQVIWSYRKHVRDSLKDDYDHEFKFKNVHTLVVDECSLVAVTTFQTLFRILREEAKLRKVVLLGDVRQLPSIEAGNFLSDVFRSLTVLGCSVELKTNHRSESQLIVDNATKISHQQYPDFDATRNFKLHNVFVDAKTNFINLVLLRMLQKEKELYDDKTSQFISFKKKDIDTINEVACQFYNGHPQKDDKNKNMFRVNDKICVTKNALISKYEDDGDSIKPVLEDENTEKSGGDSSLCEGDETALMNDDEKERPEKNKPKAVQVRLCNGEIFFIKKDWTNSSEVRYLLLSTEDPSDPKTLWVNFRELRRSCKIKHAWARTIHTFQGSESQTVVYYLGDCVSWQNWQHVYTAVTRGKKSIHIVGQSDVLHQAVKKIPPLRFTGLHNQFKKYLPSRQDLNDSICDHLSQSDTSDTDAMLLDASRIMDPITTSGSSVSFTKLKDEGQHRDLSNTYTRQNLSRIIDSMDSPQPGPSGLQNRTLATSSPYNCQVNHSIKPNASPIVNPALPGNVTAGLGRAISPGNESQWSEMDESELFKMDEESRNNLLFKNADSESSFENDSVNRRRSEANVNHDVSESDESSLGKDLVNNSSENVNHDMIVINDTDSDSTASPNEEHESMLSSYLIKQSAEKLVNAEHKNLNQKRRKQAGGFDYQGNGLKLSDGSKVSNFLESERGQKHRDLPLANSEESESQSILEWGQGQNNKVTSAAAAAESRSESAESVEAYKNLSRSNTHTDSSSFSMPRYQSSSCYFSDSSDNSDSDDGRTSPSLISRNRSSKGLSTPKKQKLLPSATFVSPARKQLASLDF